MEGFIETTERKIIDLSNFKSNGKQYVRQTSDVVYVKKVSDRWEDLYIRTQFYLGISGKWIDSWHKIGTRMYNRS